MRQIIPDLHVLEPQNEMEELMMLFGDAPWSDRNEIAHIVMDAIEELGDENRLIINSIFYQQCSYSELGAILGCSKPHAWRKAQVAFAEMKQVLLNNPILKEKYA